MVCEIMNFKDNLIELLRLHNISQIKLAKEIGVSQRAVSKWCIGQSEPTASNIYKIAIYFDVTADFLLGLSEI